MMRYKYLMLNRNNGHEITYHPFTCESHLTQEKVTEWLNTIPGAGRTGAGLSHLLDILDKKNIKADIAECPCCNQRVKSLNELEREMWVNGTETLGYTWTILEGISGNY